MTTFEIKKIGLMTKKIIHQGKQIGYNIYGKGPTLMLIHGFTEHSGIWNEFAHSLQSEYTIITPDLPAHGESDFPENLSMEYIADALDAVLFHESIEKAILVGHSMGGYAALNMATKYPELIQGLCLFHSSARADGAEVKQNRERTIEIIQQHHFSFLHSFIPDLFAPQNREPLKEKIHFLMNEAEKISAEGLIACMNAMKDRSGSIEFLATTPIPIGFIIGKLDSRVAFETILAQTALPKQSHVLILDHCGHMGYLEKPNETLAFIRSFALACL